MEGSKFTWFPKLTLTVEKVPEEQRGQLLWALATYGTYGEEPSLEWPLDAIFEGLREDIDFSKRSIASGGTGGRGKRKGGAQNSEPSSGVGDTTLFKDENGGFEDSEPISVQNISKQVNTKQNNRFTKPILADVIQYASELGNTTFDAQGFIDYYESNGWKVGRNPMKDWKATVRNWVRKDSGKGASYVSDYD